MNLTKKRKKKGFTLIELMAVIAIIAILAAVLVPTVSGYITRSKKTAILTQVRTAVNAVEAYNATAGNAPITNETTIAQLVNRDGAKDVIGSTGNTITAAVKGALVTQELLLPTDVNKLADGVTVGELKQINNDKESAMNKMTKNSNVFQYSFTKDTTLSISTNAQKNITTTVN